MYKETSSQPLNHILLPHIIHISPFQHLHSTTLQLSQDGLPPRPHRSNKLPRPHIRISSPLRSSYRYPPRHTPRTSRTWHTALCVPLACGPYIETSFLFPALDIPPSIFRLSIFLNPLLLTLTSSLFPNRSCASLPSSLSSVPPFLSLPSSYIPTPQLLILYPRPPRPN